MAILYKTTHTLVIKILSISLKKKNEQFQIAKGWANTTYNFPSNGTKFHAKIILIENIVNR